jgi:hypothetical protein
MPSKYKEYTAMDTMWEQRTTCHPANTACWRRAERGVGCRVWSKAWSDCAMDHVCMQVSEV